MTHADALNNRRIAGAPDTCDCTGPLTVVEHHAGQRLGLEAQTYHVTVYECMACPTRLALAFRELVADGVTTIADDYQVLNVYRIDPPERMVEQLAANFTVPGSGSGSGHKPRSSEE